MKILSKEQVILLHESLIKAFGGYPGLRDEGLLDSALAAPFQSFSGESAYPSPQAKARPLRIWNYSESSVRRWKQADWNTCHVGVFSFERH